MIGERAAGGTRQSSGARRAFISMCAHAKGPTIVRIRAWGLRPEGAARASRLLSATLAHEPPFVATTRVTSDLALETLERLIDRLLSSVKRLLLRPRTPLRKSVAPPKRRKAHVRHLEGGKAGSEEEALVARQEARDLSALTTLT